MRNGISKAIGTAGGLWLWVAVSHAQFILDGDFDSLPIGLAPNCVENAGAWQWPRAYVEAGLCEQWLDQFQIVPTNSFAPRSAGNSLQMNVLSAPQGATFQLPNVFAQPILERPGERAIVQFNVWVPQPGVKGGYIYVGGDHGGDGFSESNDRGPQLCWQPGGAITRSPMNLDVGAIPLLANYPNSQWQTVRLSISLVDDRYTIWWGTDGNPTVLLDVNAPFHAGVQLTHLDRFTIGHLVKNAVDAHMYLDNVVVEVESFTPPSELILDGDFDSLPAGTAPNCDQYAGAWGWPGLYSAFEGLCEPVPGAFEIVPTSTFDPAASGQSLHLNVINSLITNHYHLPNVFTQMVYEQPGQLVVVEFDIWVPQAGVKGGHIYISGNHGSGGYGNLTDRGPQMGWTANGAITRAGPPSVVVHQNYPIAAWQRVRLVIDLVDDNYDIWWSSGGSTLVLLDRDAPFRGGVLLNHLDRFTVVHFGETGGTTSRMYMDNLNVNLMPNLSGDVNADGAVNVSDLLLVISQWGPCPPAPPNTCAADADDDGQVSVTDLLIVINNWS